MNIPNGAWYVEDIDLRKINVVMERLYRSDDDPKLRTGDARRDMANLLHAAICSILQAPVEVPEREKGLSLKVRKGEYLVTWMIALGLLKKQHD